MKNPRWLAVVAILMIAGASLTTKDCRAEAKCPWLNVATAAGLLGGQVQLTVSAPIEPAAKKYPDDDVYRADQVRADRFDVSCEFSRKVDSAVYSLHIDVKTMGDSANEFTGFLAQCGGAMSALKGIGNEAFQCDLKKDSSDGLERVIGRVRDRAFVMIVSRAAPTGVSEGGLRDDTRNIAEQIAGNLF